MKKLKTKISLVLGIALLATILFAVPALANSKDHDNDKFIHGVTTKSWFGVHTKAWQDRGYVEPTLIVEEPVQKNQDIETPVQEQPVIEEPVSEEAGVETQNEEELYADKVEEKHEKIEKQNEYKPWLKSRASITKDNRSVLREYAGTKDTRNQQLEFKGQQQKANKAQYMAHVITTIVSQNDNRKPLRANAGGLYTMISQLRLPANHAKAVRLPIMPSPVPLTYGYDGNNNATGEIKPFSTTRGFGHIVFENNAANDKFDRIANITKIVQPMRAMLGANSLTKEESLQSALRRFKRSTARDGIIPEVRKREHYEKPSTKRKKKSEAARKRKY